MDAYMSSILGWAVTIFLFILNTWAISSTVLRFIAKHDIRATSGGNVAPGWERVAEVFRKNLKSGDEKGGAFAVYYHDKKVVDIWGGYADIHARWPWQEYTLTQCFSVTKAFVAIIVARFVERGLLRYEDRIAKIWPEFAQNGKGDITVKELATHTAGVAVIDKLFKLKEIKTNPDNVEYALASQKPNWKPGKSQGYHALTFGLYFDEIIRRVDPEHRRIYQIVREEVTQQFGLDFQIGLAKEENHRCARVVPLERGIWFYFSHMWLPWKYQKILFSAIVRPFSYTSRIGQNPVDFGFPPVERANHPDRRAIRAASSHGFGTARAIAKFYSILVNGGNYLGRQLLSPQMIEEISQPHSIGIDEIILSESVFGLGLRLFRRTFKGEERFIFGHPGYGGQMAMCDPKHKLSCAYLTNFISMQGDGDDPRYLSLENAMYECVRDLEGH